MTPKTGPRPCPPGHQSNHLTTKTLLARPYHASGWTKWDRQWQESLRTEYGLLGENNPGRGPHSSLGGPMAGQFPLNGAPAPLHPYQSMVAAYHDRVGRNQPRLSRGTPTGMREDGSKAHPRRMGFCLLFSMSIMRIGMPIPSLHSGVWPMSFFFFFINRRDPVKFYSANKFRSAHLRG